MPLCVDPQVDHRVVHHDFPQFGLKSQDRYQLQAQADMVLEARTGPKDGVDFEDWVYGTPPGKIVFVTFEGDKVVKVKEDYAGLGTDVGSVKK